MEFKHILLAAILSFSALTPIAFSQATKEPNKAAGVSPEERLIGATSRLEAWLVTGEKPAAILTQLFENDLAADYYDDRGLNWDEVKERKTAPEVVAADKSFSSVVFPTETLETIRPLAERLLDPKDGGRVFSGDKTLTADERGAFTEQVLFPLLKGIFATCGIREPGDPQPHKRGKYLSLFFDFTRVDKGFAETRMKDPFPSYDPKTKTISLNTAYKVRLDIADLLKADASEVPNVDGFLNRLYVTIFHEAIHIYLIEAFTKVVGAKLGFDQKQPLKTAEERHNAHQRAQLVASLYIARINNRGLYNLDEAFVNLTVLRALNLVGLPHKITAGAAEKASKSDSYFTFDGLSSQIAPNFGMFLFDHGYLFHDAEPQGTAFLAKVVDVGLSPTDPEQPADLYEYLEGRQPIFERYTEMTLQEFGLNDLLNLSQNR